MESSDIFLLKVIECTYENWNRKTGRKSDIGEEFMRGWRHWKPPS
jgi:hypothetical protein